MKRRLLWSGGVFFALVFAFAVFGFWSATSQLLFPAWRGATKDLAVCPAEAERHWGKNCGNLRQTGAPRFQEVSFQNAAAQKLSGWLIRTSENGFREARGAILLVHGGGSDRREMTRFVLFYLKQRLDVLTFDYSCHGEAPCAVPGLSYGERESRDVVAAYSFLKNKYARIYAFGSSVGATAVLVALPQLEGIAGVIAENPPYSFARLMRETPAAPRGIPQWITNRMIGLTQWRGAFGGARGAPEALAEVRTPVFFIHSKKDEIVPWQHSADLAKISPAANTLWLPEYGSHGAVWDANREEYEKRVSAFLAE